MPIPSSSDGLNMDAMKNRIPMQMQTPHARVLNWSGFCSGKVMHYSCRIKSNRSERHILKVTDGYQAQVSESICFSLETAVGWTAEHAEYAERRGRMRCWRCHPSDWKNSSQRILLPRVLRILRFICSFWILDFKFQIWGFTKTHIPSVNIRLKSGFTEEDNYQHELFFTNSTS